MVISKGMVVAAAAIAFGLVAVEEMAKAPISGASFTDARTATTDDAVVQNGALRRRAAETLRALIERQDGARTPGFPALSQKCRDQSWPYYSGDCLVRSGGTEITPPVRIVRVDRPAAAPLQVAELR